jgi:ATP-binding cassette subfamily A (ABC1) protein 3
MCAVKVQLDDYEAVQILRPIQKRTFLLIPYLSFFHSQISFYTTAQKNARCKKMPNEFYNTMCNPLHPNLDICCGTIAFLYITDCIVHKNDFTLFFSFLFLI